jgi:6-phosphogluconolactonase
MAGAGMSDPGISLDLQRWETNRELSVRLAVNIATNLAAAIHERGTATLAVSGGSTPKLLFEQLSLCPLDWSRVTVTQVDERWLEEDHEDSNARLIRDHLLKNEATVAKFVSMKTSTESPFDAEVEVAEKLSGFAKSIDVVVLGMGEDGHTASFFPGANTLARALDPLADDICVAVRPPSAPHDRMTLSLPALLRARHLYLHIVGEQKWAVLQRAAGAGDVKELPIRGVLFAAHSRLQTYYASGN